MLETRRRFFLKVTLLSGTLTFPREIFTVQNPPTPPPKPQPGYTPNPAEIHSNPAEAAAKRARFLENEKEFREGVDRLYELTSSLRDELQKTPTAEVFSLHIVKKTEEIESSPSRSSPKPKPHRGGNEVQTFCRLLNLQDGIGVRCGPGVENGSNKLRASFRCCSAELHRRNAARRDGRSRRRRSRLGLALCRQIRPPRRSCCRWRQFVPFTPPCSNLLRFRHEKNSLVSLLSSRLKPRV